MEEMAKGQVPDHPYNIKSTSPEPDGTLTSMGTMQGSITGEILEQHALTSDHGLQFISSDTASDRVHRLMNDRRERKQQRNHCPASYETITNKLYFDALSMEEKYFVPSGSGQEINSAADLLDFLTEDVLLPSFYDDEISESDLCAMDILDERKKFCEMLGETSNINSQDINRLVDNKIYNTDEESSISSDTLIAPPVQFQMCQSDNSEVEETSEKSGNFCFITEDEYNRSKMSLAPATKNENGISVTPTYASNHLSFPASFEEMKLESSPSTPNCSLSNLEHPSYQRSFNIYPKKRIGSTAVGSLHQLTESVQEQPIENMNFTEKQIYSNKMKPIVVGFKEKISNTNIYSTQNSIIISKTKYKPKQRYKRNIRRHLSDNVEKLNAKQIICKPTWKCRSLPLSPTSTQVGTTSHKSIEASHLSCTNHRPNMLYNLEIVSLHNFANTIKPVHILSRNDSVRSEPMLMRKQRSQSLDDLYLSDNEPSISPTSFNQPNRNTSTALRQIGSRFQTTTMYPSKTYISSGSGEEISLGHSSQGHQDQMSATSILKTTIFKDDILDNNLSVWKDEECAKNVSNSSHKLKFNVTPDSKDLEFQYAHISVSKEASCELQNNNFKNQILKDEIRSDETILADIVNNFISNTSKIIDDTIPDSIREGKTSFVDSHCSISLKTESGDPFDENLAAKSLSDTCSRGVKSASCADRLFYLTCRLPMAANAGDSYDYSQVSLEKISSSEKNLPVTTHLIPSSVPESKNCLKQSSNDCNKKAIKTTTDDTPGTISSDQYISSQITNHEITGETSIKSHTKTSCLVKSKQNYNFY